MFDTHAVACALTDADIMPMQADAVRQAAEYDAPGIARRRLPRSRTSSHSVRRFRRASLHLRAARLDRQDPVGSGLMGAMLVKAVRGDVAYLMVSAGRERPVVPDGGRR